MPHFQIKLLKGKTDVQKRALATEVVKAAQKVIGFGDESYSVTIEDFTWEEWKSEVYPNAIYGNREILFKKPGYSV